MIKSIRLKLFIGISALIILFILLFSLLNTLYLGKYYISEKTHTLIQGYTAISSTYTGDVTAIYLQLEKLTRTAGVNIIILGKNYELKYNPLPWSPPRRGMGRQPDSYVDLFRSQAPHIAKGNYIIKTTIDPRLNTNFLNLISVLNNGDFLLLSTPLTAIRENAKIANKFFMFTGLLILIIGCIAIFIFTKRFTLPILELNDIARRMATLDFSKKYDVKTSDEIGELGKSINSLSEQLDKSIWELKKANERLKEDLEQERKIDEMRKEFISNVSHELKTPIALIQGYSEGLKLNVIEDEEGKNYYCDVIADEASKMNRLVMELLDLSRIESGGFQLEIESFDISLLVDQVLDKYRLIFAEKNINLMVENEKGIYVEGDDVRIEQVLVNYLNNALNHVDERKLIKIVVKKLDTNIRVSVFNSGNNILKEALDKIWLSFYKVDKARTRAYGGTGLGLSIVRAIMDLHKSGYGAINIEGGVEFYFELKQH